MRLQLDPALTGSGIAKPGETGQNVPVGGSGSDSRRIGTNSTGGDSVHISGPSSALGRLSADRTARIQQLTSLIQGGSYQISGSQISRSIVASALSYGGAENGGAE